MIILFGNQKGGCGKTTNCIPFANYLVEKGKEVIVLDLDFQRSLSDRRKEDIATYDNAVSYTHLPFRSQLLVLFFSINSLIIFL